MLARLAAPLILAVALAALPALAHDFWIDVPQPRLAAPGTVGVSFLVGDAAAHEAWPVEWRRIVSLRSYGPDGVTDQQPGVRLQAPSAPGGAAVALRTPGTHIVAFETALAESDLAPAAFAAYLAHEGLTPAIEARARLKLEATRGRETYSRRAKALVQVGPDPTDTVSRPIGQTLELVPERNPFALVAGESLALRVYWHGRPLVGATVSLAALGRPGEVSRVSDSAGRVTFALSGGGRWRAATVWTQPVTQPRADFDTVFASLSFATRATR